MNINRRADRGRMGKSQRSGKPFGFSAPLRIPLSGIPFSPSLLQAKDDLSINVRKILDTTPPKATMRSPSHTMSLAVRPAVPMFPELATSSTPEIRRSKSGTPRVR